MSACRDCGTPAANYETARAGLCPDCRDKRVAVQIEAAPTIAVDDHFGHVTLHDPETYPNGHFATIVDSGQTCHVHPGAGMRDLHLTEWQARELGTALIGWAGRKRLARSKT